MVEILGCRVDDVNMSEALDHVQRFIEHHNQTNGNHHIITLNAEIIYRARDDEQLKSIINQAELVTPDGTGVLWAAEQLGQPLRERVTGIDLMINICRQAQTTGWRLYLLGSAPGVAETAAQKIQEQYPGATVVGTHDGYFSANQEESLITEINATKPDVLFVALGAPKQEFWIAQNRQRLTAAVLIGVGGSLDVLSGNVKRAPKLWQKLRMEWFWRLVSDPKRAGRMSVLPKFMREVKKSK